MGDSLSFESLVPQRHNFVDQDGQSYEFRSPDDFGAVDVARLRRVNKVIQEASDRLADNPDDEDLAARFEAEVSAGLAFILPELPAERRAALSLGQQTRILKWWNEHHEIDQNGAGAEGEAAAGQSG